MQDDIGPGGRKRVLVAALGVGRVEDEELRDGRTEQTLLHIGLAMRIFLPPRIVLYDRLHRRDVASKADLQEFVTNLGLYQELQKVLCYLDVLCAFRNHSSGIGDDAGNRFPVIAE